MVFELDGSLVALRPIQVSDGEELWAHTGNDASLWKWVLTDIPIPQSVVEMRSLISNLLDRDSKGARKTFAGVPDGS